MKKNRAFKSYIQSFVTVALRCVCRTYFKVDVRGLEHLPKSGSYVLTSNHASHLDSVALIVASKRSIDDFVFMAAKDYFFKGGLYTKIMNLLLNLVPLDRGIHSKGLQKNLQYLKACKEAGKIIVLFPEGTRSASGELQKFKVGIGVFANALKIPTVPSYIKGTHRLLPKGKLFPKPGEVRVSFGPPLYTNVESNTESFDIADIKHKEFTLQLREKIVALRDGSLLG